MDKQMLRTLLIWFFTVAPAAVVGPHFQFGKSLLGRLKAECSVGIMGNAVFSHQRNVWVTI